MLCFYENSRNQYRVFKLKFFHCFFSVFFFCVLYFSFALLTNIRTTRWQKTHIDMASIINKIIIYNYEIMVKIKIWRHIEFSEKLFNFELSGSHSFQLEHKRSLLLHLSTFASLKCVYAHKTQSSLWWCWLIWLSPTFSSQARN